MRFSQFTSFCFASFCFCILFVSLSTGLIIGVTNAETSPDQTVSSENAQSATSSSRQEFLTQADLENLSPWLKDIPLKTRRRGILPEESEIYYQILAYARDVDTKRIKKAARHFLTKRWKQSKYQKQPFEKFPVFVDMYQHPELYQGRPVTMTGHIQRSVVSKASSNEFAVDTICEAWLFTEDSQANPTVVVSTHFPPNFPVGEQTIDHVRVTGYIYRMYTYDARDSRRFAPLLVAHEIHWVPESKSGKSNNSLQGLLTLLLVILILGSLLGVTLLKLHRKKERTRKNVAQVLAESSQPNFDFKKN